MSDSRKFRFLFFLDVVTPHKFSLLHLILQTNTSQNTYVSHAYYNTLGPGVHRVLLGFQYLILMAYVSEHSQLSIETTFIENTTIHVRSIMSVSVISVIMVIFP